MLASGFCFSGDERLSTTACEEGGEAEEVWVNARRNSSGGGEFLDGRGDSPEGGESREDRGKGSGLPGGGLRMLLID